MFAGTLQLAKAMGQPIHSSLEGTVDYPYTISFAIRKRMQYDSFLELPKEKQPPDDYWDDPEMLEDWFDKVFNTKGKKGQAPDSIAISINDIEG